MKTLSSYKDKAQSELFETAGAFFAFSNKQFDENKVAKVEYVSIASGLICPVDTIQGLMVDLETLEEQAIKAHLADYKIEDIILYQLLNHEYSYTYDIEPTLDALQGYNVTVEQVRAVVKANYDRIMEDS